MAPGSPTVTRGRAATDVTIDAFHARYQGLDRWAADRLDRVMSDLVAITLSRALANRQLPDVYAVCIPYLEVPVLLDPDASPRLAAERWAEQLIDEVAAVVTAAHRTDLGTTDDRALTVPGSRDCDQPVVYRRELDAVVDFVTSAAAGDRARLWAWNQIGLWTHSTVPAGDDVARLLARRPELAAPVLQIVGRSGSLPLSAGGWHAVAASVVTLVGSTSTTEAAADLLVAAGVGPPGSATRQGGGRVFGPRWPDRIGPPAALIESNRDYQQIAAVIPEAVWHGGTIDQCLALATLALAVRAPTLVRGPEAVAAVVAAAISSPSMERTASESGPGGPESRETAAGCEDPPAGIDDALATADTARTPTEPDPGPSPLPAAEPMETEHGGVLFLIHPLVELAVLEEIEAAEPAPFLAELVSSITGVPVDDPAVLLLAGGERDVVDSVVSTVDRTILDAQAARVTAWLRKRLDPGSDDDQGFDWIWRRHAVIENWPGWIEATMALDSVDLRIRAAALDLDPGFVWWLGSIVRFRYD
jgi:hypothetical protein